MRRRTSPGRPAARSPSASTRRLVVKSQARGRLLAAQHAAPLPFTPRRCVVIMDVPRGAVRGEHAHIRLKQFLVCLRGSVTVRTDDGRRRRETVLKDAGSGLYLAPMVWAAQYRHSRDAILLVLASAKYDPRDYIRDYAEFRRRAAARRRR